MHLMRQAVITTIAALFGATPGILLWVFGGYPLGFGVVLSLLGAFIAGTLTLPGVSAARVFGHTAGVIVSHNVGRPIGDAVAAAISGEEDEVDRNADNSDRPYRPRPDFDFLKEIPAPPTGSAIHSTSEYREGPSDTANGQVGN